MRDRSARRTKNRSPSSPCDVVPPASPTRQGGVAHPRGVEGRARRRVEGRTDRRRCPRLRGRRATARFPPTETYAAQGRGRAPATAPQTGSDGRGALARTDDTNPGLDTTDGSGSARIADLSLGRIADTPQARPRDAPRGSSARTLRPGFLRPTPASAGTGSPPSARRGRGPRRIGELLRLRHFPRRKVLLGVSDDLGRVSLSDSICVDF